jgi:Ca2+:H+ antiporter
VLMPETFAAVRAAARNRMQTSLNLALGSALASIGLTIPAVVAVAMLIGQPLALGLPAKETALLAPCTRSYSSRSCSSRSFPEHRPRK